MTEPTLVHATCVALGDLGILLLGPPGSGKSDLALRLIDQPGHGILGTSLTAILVSDDQTRIERRGDELFASPPQTIAGKLEIRGLGIVALPYLREVRLGLATEHQSASGIERAPAEDERRLTVAGIGLPLVAVDFAAASAPARLRAALASLPRRHIAS